MARPSKICFSGLGLVEYMYFRVYNMEQATIIQNLEIYCYTFCNLIGQSQLLVIYLDT